METPKNCWDYFECGRSLDGNPDSLESVCPAAIDPACDGINSGKNAGRICWAIKGTFCKGAVGGAFAEKRYECLSCDFFEKVKAEEGNLFTFLPPSYTE